MQKLYLLVPLAPLIGAVIAGLFGRFIGPIWSHRVTIGFVFVSLVASTIIFFDVLEGNSYNGSVYTWLISGDTRFEVGFLIDQLTATMMVVVSLVSLMVHIYTIGYINPISGYYTVSTSRISLPLSKSPVESTGAAKSSS